MSHPEIESLKHRWNQVELRVKETEAILVNLDKEKQEIETQAKSLRETIEVPVKEERTLKPDSTEDKPSLI